MSKQKAPHFIKCGHIPKLRNWRILPNSQLTRAERNMRFVERYLKAPGGSYVGKPIKLAPFQESFFYSVFDNPHITRTAILSKARKNAKTATIAMIVLCFLVGPEAIQNAIIVSGARSQKQAAMIFRFAKNMVNQSPELSGLVKVTESSKRLHGIPMGTEYSALSAEGKTAHGDGPLVAILDEAGQVRGEYDAFIEAIITSQGSYTSPLLFIISTQAPTDADWLSIQIDDAINSQDPKTVCHLYAADDECDLDDEEQWKKANPAYGLFLNENEIIEAAEKAMRMPSFENTFRNLHLNQRIALESPFVSKGVWMDNAVKEVVPRGTPVYAGLDLSAVSDLTALVLVSNTGAVEPIFWLPNEGLREKSKADRVPYDRWHEMGLLRTTPGRSIEYEYIAHELRRVFNEYDVQQINFDRYAMRFLKPWLEKVGFSVKEMEKFKDFGQGMFSMSPALRDLEAKLLQKQIKHGANPILTMCAHNCKIEMDAAGNRKFTKKKSTGRIDGMVALAMAVAAWTSHETVKSGEWSLHFI